MNQGAMNRAPTAEMMIMARRRRQPLNGSTTETYPLNFLLHGLLRLRWVEEPVGWVQRSETHHFFSRLRAKAMGSASLHPSYAMAVFCQALGSA